MSQQQNQNDLAHTAAEVLRANNTGQYTLPAYPLYQEQWLWDSAFIAIGLRHIDAYRAQQEILRLLSAQWANGMVPHMIYGQEVQRTIRDVWRSWVNPNAPEDLVTSGITQPPLLAEAVSRIAEKLKPHERKSWIKKTLPALISYHEWLYSDRDPHDEGLVLQIHPWETGLDNTTPWMKELHQHQLPLWIQAVQSLRIAPIFTYLRSDTKIIPAEQRMTTIDALALYSVQRRLRRKNYDIKRILAHSLFAIEDVSFNAIFIRNNQILTDLANEIKVELSETLQNNIKRTKSAFLKLWDPYSSQYYSREFVSHRLLKEPSIGTLIALYAGVIPDDHVKAIVHSLEDEQQYGTPYPVPSVPLSSNLYDPERYWQGPTWINTNWLIIDGLKRHGYEDHAAVLTESTLELIEHSGCAEYFHPTDGSPLGAKDFSWTAALALDLYHSRQ